MEKTIFTAVRAKGVFLLSLPAFGFAPSVSSWSLWGLLGSSGMEQAGATLERSQAVAGDLAGRELTQGRHLRHRCRSRPRASMPATSPMWC